MNWIHPTENIFDTTEMQKACLKITNEIWAKRENEVRKMLGQWVSELEPILIFKQDERFNDRLIGLGWIGDNKVYIHAAPGTP